MKVKYNTGGKSPVDPPSTSPDSKSNYNIGNMYFQGEEADRLIAFDQYLEKEFPNLDLFQKAEQVEKFLNANAHKSNEAMDSYSVDPALSEVQASTISDMFESEFGSSMFGGSDSFDDDPDVQRMREEAAARKNKKGRRNKKFEGGGVTMKVKYKRKPKKYENGGKPPVVIKKDAREEIVKLNSQKLKSDMTEVYEEMKAKGIDGNSGAAGFIKNRMELDNFIEKAKADGLTNAQALARFKKQFKL